MSKKYRFVGLGLLLLGVIGALVSIGVYLSGADIAVLNPKGTIADKEYQLIVTATLLSLLIIVPVFIMTFTIVWKYRAHKNAKYTPDWDGDRRLETLWWSLPLILILILSGIIWQSSHALDPFKPLASNTKPLNIQVVALQWKWLFLYPEQGIASVNYVQFPVDTPLNFTITSDAPMNSFWIPQLGGQIYAMSGMSTKLHLMASETGDFRGSSANLSGDGFAGMHFMARSVAADEFEDWVHNVQLSANKLDTTLYEQLAKPSKDRPPAFYALRDRNLYDKVVMKYMAPGEFQMYQTTLTHMPSATSPDDMPKDMEGMDHGSTQH